MTTTELTRRSATAALLIVTAVFAGSARAASGSHGTAVREVSIAYHAFDGRLSHATVLLPASYDPAQGSALPLIISPHGRGLDGRANAQRWGDLPALDGFVVVNPDGEGSHLSGRFSWGAPGQIDDLARMPEIVGAALRIRIDPLRIYAVGGSMGGEETLLLLARHPGLLAGAVAVDPVVDLARQFRSSTGTRGATLRRLARDLSDFQESAPLAGNRDPSIVARFLVRRVPHGLWSEPAVRFGRCAVLEGVGLSRTHLAPGDPLPLDLYFRALGHCPPDARVGVGFTPEPRQRIPRLFGGFHTPALGRFPLSDWRAGEIVKDPVHLVVPTGLRPGRLTVRVSIGTRGSLLETDASQPEAEVGTLLIEDE